MLFSYHVQVSAGWLNTCRTDVFIVLSHHNLGMATYKLQLYCSIFFGTDVFRMSIIIIYSVVLFTVSNLRFHNFGKDRSTNNNNYHDFFSESRRSKW